MNSISWLWGNGSSSRTIYAEPNLDSQSEKSTEEGGIRREKLDKRLGLEKRVEKEPVAKRPAVDYDRMSKHLTDLCTGVAETYSTLGNLSLWQKFRVLTTKKPQQEYTIRDVNHLFKQHKELLKNEQLVHAYGKLILSLATLGDRWRAAGYAKEFINEFAGRKLTSVNGKQTREEHANYILEYFAGENGVLNQIGNTRQKWYAGDSKVFTSKLGNFFCDVFSLKRRKFHKNTSMTLEEYTRSKYANNSRLS